MAAGSYRLIPQAQQDFLQAYEYLYSHSASAASKFETLLLHAFEHIAEWPESGHLRLELTDLPFRFWSCWNYIVVYDPRSKPLPIVAILHGAQDVDSIVKDHFPTE